jgi:hypothetical protein
MPPWRLFAMLTAAGTAWTLHLFAAYFVVALGCPRAWPGLGWLLAGATGLFAVIAAGTGAGALRMRRRAGRSGAADVATLRLVLGVAALLAGLFTVGIVLGGTAAALVPVCQDPGVRAP